MLRKTVSSKTGTIGKFLIYFLVLIVSYYLVNRLIFTLENLYVLHSQDSDPKILFLSVATDVLSGLSTKDEPFSKLECTTKKCSVVFKKEFYNIEDYDAIVFDEDTQHPEVRYDHQKYVFISEKPPKQRSSHNTNYHVTMTYRMDSDIYISPFSIVDTSGNVVSPKLKPSWKRPDVKHLQDMLDIFKRKSKLVAWLNRNETESNLYVQKLRQYIEVDEYTSEDDLYARLKGDYYFYLSFEDTMCVDYVSEKVTKALLYETVPIINSGAELDRFLPMGSYLDGAKLAPGELADRLQTIVKVSEEYLKYFWWRKYYKVEERIFGVGSPLCHLCAILHEPQVVSSNERNFSDWWHGSLTNPICRQFKS
ncbi:alpha-(1,3)-fucosyltransferase C-like [Arctopsyche grandis]|uniref:alpha-(1,3)-fucosyltransferase C-like n=1 Tax=Arctopsyche grandis TaxID=121162 RepID=UPI00406D6AD1